MEIQTAPGHSRGQTNNKGPSLSAPEWFLASALYVAGVGMALNNLCSKADEAGSRDSATGAGRTVSQTTKAGSFPFEGLTLPKITN